MAKVKRSPNYPYIKLEDAIARLQRVYDNEDNHYAPVAAIASHWGMSTKSSSLGKVIGALIQYGLLEEKGSGEARQLKITDRGLNILIHQEGEPERAIALREAALGPKLHRELWEKYEGRLPASDQSLRVYLIKDREDGCFNKDRVDAFLSAFRHTLSFAKVGEDANIEPAVNEDSKLVSEEKRMSAVDTKRQNRSGMRDLPITLPSLRIANISLPERMTELEFTTLVATIQAWKGALVGDPDESSE